MEAGVGAKGGVNIEMLSLSLTLSSSALAFRNTFGTQSENEAEK